MAHPMTLPTSRRRPLNLLSASLIVTAGVLALAAAGSAFAQTPGERLSDAQYIRAAACAAWEPAVSQDSVVAERVAAEERGRHSAVLIRAEAAADTAARQARRAQGDALALEQLDARFAEQCSSLAGASPRAGGVSAAH